MGINNKVMYQKKTEAYVTLQLRTICAYFTNKIFTIRDTFIFHSSICANVRRGFLHTYVRVFPWFRFWNFVTPPLHTLAYSPRKKFIHMWIYVEKFRRIREIICVKVKSAKHWARQTIRESFVNRARFIVLFIRAVKRTCNRSG